MSRGGASPETFGFHPVMLPQCKGMVKKQQGSSAILTEGLRSSERLRRMDDDGDRRREATGFGKVDTGGSGTCPEATGSVPHSPTEVVRGLGSPGTNRGQGIAAVGNSPEKNTGGGIGVTQSFEVLVDGSGGKRGARQYT